MSMLAKIFLGVVGLASLDEHRIRSTAKNNNNSNTLFEMAVCAL
jgi:hypothetical protein